MGGRQGIAPGLQGGHRASRAGGREDAAPQVEQLGLQGGHVLTLIGAEHLLKRRSGGGLVGGSHAVGVAKLGGFAVQLFEDGAAFGIEGEGVGGRGLRLLAVLLVPFIHLSVYLFRTLHPMPVVLKPSAPSLPPAMQTTLLVAFGAFALLFVGLLRARLRYAAERDLLLLRETEA